MLAGMRVPPLLVSVFLLACAAESGETGTATETAERLAALAAELDGVVEQRDQLEAQLEACIECRRRNIKALDAFGESEAYGEITEATVDEALALLQTRKQKAADGEKLAIVLDIDETTLSNLPELDRSDYCYDNDAWNVWVAGGRPPAIRGIDRLYAWAKNNGVEVFFITGRKEPQRAATERALRAAGFEGWAALILREEAEYELSATQYKSQRRAALEDRGYVIVLSLGDQVSDLEGGHAEATMLMPNPFYFVK